MNLTEKFPRQLEILKRLFSPKEVQNKTDRFNEILNVSERRWNENLDLLKNNQIRYLLFAEAPPWTESGSIRYFYNTFNSSWHSRIWRTFFDYPIPYDKEDGLCKLAEKRFLLVDSIPFAMKYTSQIRNNTLYQDLVNNCSSFVLSKLNMVSNQISKDIKVGLAFRLNGISIINSFPKGIKLKNGAILELDYSQIAADGSGYTNPNMLRKIYDIKNQKILQAT